MKRTLTTFARIVFLVLISQALPCGAQAEPPLKPNIIFVLADDLGYGELGCFGQKVIQTPNLDRMAKEGRKMTRFYSGNTVCAPSRAVLMTGLHNGHATIRGNLDPWAEGASLRATEPTVAKVLKQAGYRTACVGKWGLGTEKNEGHPDKQGFDEFFGFLTHKHAHNHFPDFLWRGREKVVLKNEVRSLSDNPDDPKGVTTKAVEYADDLFAEESLRFVERSKDAPFFLYHSMTIPHANNEAAAVSKNGNEVPDEGSYKDRPWNTPQRGHAAMVERLDGFVGRLLDRLRELGIAEKTLVIFSSDNGHHREGGEGPGDIFNKSGPLRGMKRDLTEGGIRVPTIAWWPGRVPADSESTHVAYFGDVLSSAAELAGVPVPEGRDGISFVPDILGKNSQATHGHLYWEFHERGFSQAVLMDGRWKAIRMRSMDAPVEIYDVVEDVGESRNVAESRPDVLARAVALFRSARTDTPGWSIPKPVSP
jgi:arylsulfatase A-like enzyme